jgi:hypothetical protein
MKKNNIEDQINRAMMSLDHIRRAEPAPFLLTRIQAAMQNPAPVINRWTLIAGFISRPVVAFSGLLLLILLNVGIIVQHKKYLPLSASDSINTDNRDEYAIQIPGIYEIENLEP